MLFREETTEEERAHEADGYVMCPAIPDRTHTATTTRDAGEKITRGFRIPLFGFRLGSFFLVFLNGRVLVECHFFISSKEKEAMRAASHVASSMDLS